MEIRFEIYGVRRGAESGCVRAYEGTTHLGGWSGPKVIGSLDFEVWKYAKRLKKPPEIRIEDIRVDEDHRRRGIATTLYQELLKHYPDSPIRTNAQLPDGVEFFSSVGFQGRLGPNQLTATAKPAKRTRVRKHANSPTGIQGRR